MAAASALVSSAAGDSKVKGRLGWGLGVHSEDMAEHGPSLLHYPLGQRRAWISEEGQLCKVG